MEGPQLANGSEITNDKMEAEAFDHYLANIPATLKTEHSYERVGLGIGVVSWIPNELKFSEVTAQEVYEVMTELEGKKSGEIDGISAIEHLWLKQFHLC